MYHYDVQTLYFSLTILYLCVYTKYLRYCLLYITIMYIFNSLKLVIWLTQKQSYSDLYSTVLTMPRHATLTLAWPIVPLKIPRHCPQGYIQGRGLECRYDRVAAASDVTDFVYIIVKCKPVQLLIRTIILHCMCHQFIYSYIVCAFISLIYNYII